MNKECEEKIIYNDQQELLAKNLDMQFEYQFWYTDLVPRSGIQCSIENLYGSEIFKNINTDTVDSNKLNFLVFNWETRWAFPNTEHTHTSEFIEDLNKLQIQNFFFIADYSGESHTRPDDLSLFFLNKLKLNNIDTDRLIVANNNSNRIGINKIRYENFRLNTIFFPNFFLSTYNHLNNYIGNAGINDTIVPDKKFLCLNRRMYHHKYKIIEELFNRGLLDDTRFTWVDNKDVKNLLNKKLAEHLNIDMRDFKSIQLEDDVMYGSDLSNHEEYLYTINPNWYYKSRVNIITETNFHESEIHITEKTWKAIYLGIPFVISASKNHLKNLRGMGFKTFNSVINEDYDEMTGDSKIKKIVDSAEELSNIFNSKGVLEICRFNQTLYFDLEHRRKVCKELFLDHLYSIEKILHSTSLI
jgi:hypothetical protein